MNASTAPNAQAAQQKMQMFEQQQRQSARPPKMACLNMH
jgi:hypothetical protein